MPKKIHRPQRAARPRGAQPAQATPMSDRDAFLSPFERELEKLEDARSLAAGIRRLAGELLRCEEMGGGWMRDRFKAAVILAGEIGTTDGSKAITTHQILLEEIIGWLQSAGFIDERPIELLYCLNNFIQTQGYIGFARARWEPPAAASTGQAPRRPDLHLVEG